MTDYKPINCDFYDLFEIHSMRNHWVEIITKDKKNHISQIQTLQTIDKEEFAVMKGGITIRLDEVDSIRHLQPLESILGLLLDKLSYNYWANLRISKVLKSAKNPNNEVIKLMSHIYNALDIWNKRMLQRTSEFGVWQLHPANQWANLQEMTFIDSIKVLNQFAPEESFHYKDSTGIPYSSQIGATIFHIINHSTYHRGQIIQLLQKDKKGTTATDYFIYDLGLSRK